MTDRFQQRKEAVLFKKDKSSIGNWDKKILKLCKKINKQKNYYTTSSCSGRIIVMIDQEKKGPGLFEFVSHSPIQIDSLREYIDNSQSTSSDCSPKENLLREKGLSQRGDQLNNNLKSNLKFKQEPPILHIACKEIEDAEKLLKKVRDCGWKRSGIISLGKNIVVEIIGTEKLEFPFVQEGKFLVDEKFLKIAIEKANENLKRGWKRIDNLEKSLESKSLNM